MNINPIARCALMLLTAVLILSACNKSDDTATLTLAVADTPTDSATSVVLTFTGVELQDGGNVPTLFRFTTPKPVDLLDEQGGNSAVLLNGVDLNSGNYRSVRLLVDMSQSSITLADGSVHPLVTPTGGDPSGFTLMNGFSAGSGEALKFTVDFDLRQAIIPSSGDYLFQPTLRLVDEAFSGEISGTVLNTLSIGGTPISSPSCSPAAYIYAGAHVVPVDLDPAQGVQPVSTASLTLDTLSGNYVYTAAFLPPKAYTIALTCAAGDNPGTSNSLTFYPPRTVTVLNGETTQANFP